MASIFTKIIDRQIPAHIIAEDDKHIAFLDINPLTKGHELAIPKKEIDYIYDLDDQDLSDLHIFAKKVAKGIQSTVSCERIGVTVMGLEVPHAHIHLIPMNDMDDMNFARPKMSFSQDAFAKIANDIASHISL